MKTINFKHIILFISLIVYLIMSLSLFDYERVTGDSTLYLSIAQKYINGDYENAINGYWGPLLSWLMVPFLFFGASHLFTMNALNAFFGLCTIIGTWKLSYRFGITDQIRNLILLPLIPINLYFSIIQPMDFLLLSVLIYYLSIVFKDDYPEKYSNGLYCGFLGALAYFSKPFGFPFFISHFLLMNIMHYFKGASNKTRMKVLKNMLAGFLIFALLSGIWIALISDKYNKITFSTMGGPNFAQHGPGLPNEFRIYGDPIFYEGFFEPPNESAFVVYEDPTYKKKIKAWSPLASWRSLKHFMNNIAQNIIESMRVYESFSRLSLSIIIACMLFMFMEPDNKLTSRKNMLYPLMTVLLYTAGYMPFHFEIRYLWIVNILVLLMGSYVLHVLFQFKLFRKKTVRVLLSVIFVLSFMLTPLKATVEASKNNINREMYTLNKALTKYSISGNIASNRETRTVTTHNSWHKTFRLSYWLQSRYYGQAKEDMHDEILDNELRKYNIDYYFYWGSPDKVPELLNQYKEVTGGEIPGLTIYSLKETR